VRPLNLARVPLRNQRLPNLAAVVALVLVLVATAVHAVALRRVLPDRTSARHRELAELDAESARLRVEAGGLRNERADARELASWTLVKDVVDRRAFSWTGLFARLEDVLPQGVRLVSIAPRVQRGEILLDVVAIGRSAEDGWELVRVLEEQPDFSEVFPRSEGENGEFQYTMRYRPGAGPRPSPPPEPAGRVANARPAVEVLP
jgi:hypothetical protein